MVVEQFDKLFADKNIPINKEVLNNGLVLYRVDYNLTTKHIVRVEVIIEDQKDVTDVQIVVRSVGFLSDYDKRGDLLEVLNALNDVKTGYYRLYLAGDGEILLKLLSRTQKDVEETYQMLFSGVHIARMIQDDIEKVTGAFENNV